MIFFNFYEKLDASKREKKTRNQATKIMSESITGIATRSIPLDDSRHKRVQILHWTHTNTKEKVQYSREKKLIKSLNLNIESPEKLRTKILSLPAKKRERDYVSRTGKKKREKRTEINSINESSEKIEVKQRSNSGQMSLQQSTKLAQEQINFRIV